MSCLSSIKEKESIPNWSSVCDLDSGVFGQLSARLFHYECDNLEWKHRAEHPNHQIPGQQTLEYHQRSLQKVFTSPIQYPHTTQEMNGSTASFTFCGDTATTSSHRIICYGDNDTGTSLSRGGMFLAAGGTGSATAMLGAATLDWTVTAGHNHGNGLRYNTTNHTVGTTWYANEYPHSGQFRLRSRHSPYVRTGNHEWIESEPEPREYVYSNGRRERIRRRRSLSYLHDNCVPRGFRFPKLKIHIPGALATQNGETFEQHMDRIGFGTMEKEFNTSLPRESCCFKPVFQPYSWYNEKTRLGEALEICDETPKHRIASYHMGVPLDYCKKHFKIALEWHQDRFKKMPSMVKKFTIKELRIATQAKIERERRELEIKTHKLQANTRADELLKKWLSEGEYNYLKEHDEVELPSQHEKDVIYIVKKNAKSKVIRKVKGLATEELCVMAVDYRLVNDDALLSKILFLKSDEREFLELANHYPLIET